MIEMRLIVSIVFAMLVVASTADKFQDWKDQMETLQGKCTNQYKLNDAAITELLNANTVDVTDKNIQKLLYCIALDQGFMDSEGTLGTEKIAEHLKKLDLDEKTIKAVNKKCSSIEKPSDKNVLVGLYYKCYENELPRKYLVL
ncbi:uncharacterized protein LOC123680216 [Harmonia axyridis]|uniref:uncharacterized protein LOC123680216 n=1 Tax=Harmonia axyridis TaxID=115357 RepID=UPI001E276D56|nr:uncharacterized protein LOC123680216 [Harmonia axyridis]